MWQRAKHLTDAQLTHFTIEEDLIEIRTGPTGELLTYHLTAASAPLITLL